MTPVEIPDAVAAKVRLLGPPGEQWVRDLPDTIAALAHDWNLGAIGRPLRGGSVGYVAEADMADGRAAVLKVALPDGVDGAGAFDREMSALFAANGDPYVDVLAYDAGRRAVLLERLGRPLGAIGLPILEQIEIIASTLARGWRKPADVQRVSGTEKARWLREYITTMPAKLEGPSCAATTIAQVATFTQRREAAFDEALAVLVHGDAHPHNVLEAGPSLFKLIDPEGLWSEPAHDLGVVLRDWNAELLSGDTRTDALARCEHMSRISGVDAAAIWEWSCIERVSTGLFMLELGHTDEGRTFLDAADVLADIDLGA